MTVVAPATPIVAAPVKDIPAADVKPKPQEQIAPEPQDAAPANEGAPIPASGLPQKTSAPVPAPHARAEHKHHSHAEKAEPATTDVPDSQPQPQLQVTAQPQTASTTAAPTPLPLHMVLPVPQRLSYSLTPLGNRIPAAMAMATRTPVRTETPAAADPFYADGDPKPAPLRAEAIKPMVATADQLAFATQVQLAKPQPVSQRVSATPATPRSAEAVHAEPVQSQSQSHSQHQHDDRGDADPQSSMKAAETAVKPAARPAPGASSFEPIHGVAGETMTPAKTASTMPNRPTSAAAAAEDITPTRPEVPAAPMKDISVRIQSEQGENVDVRILHRAGDVQIAVKSASGETTQGLRHGLSELSDRLNASGYHADTWHPGQTATAADTNTSDSGNSQHSQQQSQGDSQSNSGWSQQQGGRRDDNQSNRPRWIEELESNISSPAETGSFHGLIR
jgi:hypothetical protein